jgi:hypothetical protein
MKKILHIIHGLNIGGAENFIYNILRNIDSDKFRFDFAIQNPQIGHQEFKKLIEETGGKIYVITDFRRNILKEYRELSEILANGYDYVHIHMNAFVNPIPAIAASRFPNKVIIHSHNTHNGSGGTIARILHLINRRLFLKKRFIRLACGTEAGKWMFNHKDFKVMDNAVNLSRFRFNRNAANSIRQKYALADEPIIGHMGRFVPEKNQKFILQIFSQMKATQPNSKTKLMLCGDGPMRMEVMELARNSGVSNDVIFTGNITDPEMYYSAFDCFMLPSWFEGLAFVAIEAQASGLKVIASDTNTSEINVTGNVRFLSLQESAAKWSDAIIDALQPTDRIANAEKMRGSKHDLNRLVNTLTDVYE